MLFIKTGLPAFFLFVSCYASGQCSNPINSFPYTEDFEASNGGWTPAGTASDWSWGTPIKPVINGAASGTKCWVVGTLTQSSYSNNQNSTLTSPCFDFSSLTSPYIRFSIFWETEKKYDGASFQYSTDGGSTWTTLGSFNSAPCPTDNWYNTTGITALSGSDGWSGNIQPTAACAGGAGNGSGEWKIAQHSMQQLAGRSNVRFRFRFGAGSVCNNYDGFAIDDIWIGNKVGSSAMFTYSCNSSNTVSFIPEAPSCPGGFIWDFGDPASGAANTSTQYQPSHTFSAPGQYTVTLTRQDGSVPAPTSSQTITIIDVTADITTNINCWGDKATLQAVVTPSGTYDYMWNSSPAQTTATASNLGPGTYTVTVTGADACFASDQVTLTEPAQLNVFLGKDTVLCQGERLVLNPGAFDSYVWQDGSTASTYSVMQTGTYSVTVKDANGCSASDSIHVTVDCSDIYFPSAFTPDMDGKNDLFGALGNISGVNKYSLRIFNRWGQQIFSTSQPSEKWNGTFKGKLMGTGSYVWFAEYQLSTGAAKRKKGTVTLIR